MNHVCSNCKKEIDSTSNFCPFCGHENAINDEITTSKKIKIYLASFILTPLGFYWFFKYFRSNNPEKKKAGYYALFLTIIALLLTVILSRYYVKEFSKYIEDRYETNLDVYSELGY